MSEVQWLIELFPEQEIIAKRMFGGMAYYYQGKMILVTMSSQGDKSYRNKKYDFEIWNGLLFPLERDVHAVIFKKYPQLINHPVLGKWLYLPYDIEEFDDTAENIIKDIRRNTVLWGIWPKAKKKSSKKKKSK